VLHLAIGFNLAEQIDRIYRPVDNVGLAGVVGSSARFRGYAGSTGAG
jgi:hypothetical protein